MFFWIIGFLAFLGGCLLGVALAALYAAGRRSGRPEPDTGELISREKAVEAILRIKLKQVNNYGVKFITLEQAIRAIQGVECKEGKL